MIMNIIIRKTMGNDQLFLIYLWTREVRMTAKILSAAFTVLFGVAGWAYAAHPLITDDAGTQGKGKAQLEFTGEYGHDNEDGLITNTLIFPLTPVLSYGITDAVDLVLGIPFERLESKQAGVSTTKSGISDSSIQMKWRFYEKDGISFAVKPGVTLPTGDEDKGLGNGKSTYSAFFIATEATEPWAFHFNIGYLRNDYKLQSDEDANRKDIWHISIASQVKAVKNLTIMADIGMERNPDKNSDTNPAFLLGGIIYSVTDNLDIDFGVKGGLTRPETDISYLAGVTWRL
jgi:hypothetical protein